MAAFIPATAVQTTKALIAAQQAASPVLTDFTRGSVIRSNYEAFAIVQEQQGQQTLSDADDTIQLTVQRVLGLQPTPAVAAYGVEQFTVSTAPTSNVTLPAGFTVTVPSSTLQYQLGAATVWTAGDTTLSAVVTCNTAGDVGNIPADSLTQIVSTIPSGLTGLTCTNVQAFSTGQNAQTLADSTAEVPAALARLKAATSSAVEATALQATVANSSGYVTEAVTASISATGGYVTPPATSPTLTAISPTTATSLVAGAYTVAVTFTTAVGETPPSPVSTVTLTAGQAITVSAIALPSAATTPPSPNATGINYYLSTSAGSTTLGFVESGTGAAMTLSALPASGAVNPPTANTAWAQTFGFATCWIANGLGTVASGALVSNAQQLINGYTDSAGISHPGTKAAGILATVVPAFLLQYNVVLAVLPLPGYTLAMVEDGVDLAIEAYFAGLDIGQGISLNTLILTIMDVVGVADVVMSAPTANVSGLLGTQYLVGTISATQMA